jgi:small neutral amino acid transporter SnatA (MarC family)
MRSFLLAFIPLFVAVDVVGLMPIYLGISGGIDEPERQQLVLEARSRPPPSAPASSSWATRS